VRERGINLRGFEMEVRSKDNGKLLRQSGPVLVELIGCGMAKGDRDLAEYFADRGKLVAADLDVKHAGWTALTRASIKGYLDIVKALLAAGADKDTYGGFGVTPLIWAATQGHLKVVQVLLKAGAKVDKANKYGDSALIFATIRGHTEIVRLLQAAAAAAVAKKK
jgi:ankyrin repeat protein